jgi:hypothetical protein
MVTEKNNLQEYLEDCSCEYELRDVVLDSDVKDLKDIIEVIEILEENSSYIDFKYKEITDRFKTAAEKQIGLKYTQLINAFIESIDTGKMQPFQECCAKHF